MPTTSKPRCLSLTQSELDKFLALEARVVALEAAMDKVLKK